jgi:hypothetical protein
MRKVAVVFVTALLGLGFFGCSAKGDSHGAGSGGAMPGTGGATGQVGSGGATAGGGGASSQTGGGRGRPGNRRRYRERRRVSGWWLGRRRTGGHGWRDGQRRDIGGRRHFHGRTNQHGWNPRRAAAGHRRTPACLRGDGPAEPPGLAERARVARPARVATTGQSPYKGVANSPAAQLAALGATWCYNWGTSPKASDCNDPLFVPMVWGGGDVAGAIKAIGDAGYKTVLGFNEPNKTDQSNMTVDAAIALWPTLTSNPNIRVSSPAVSDDGRAWLESFMTQVKAKGLRVDFIAMHWYGWNAGSCTSGQLEGAINWASKWGLPVWITEFGCMGSSNPDEQTLITFFNNSIPMLKNHPLVERYAWYPWNTYNDLYRANASGVSVITSLGTAFAAAPQYR